jgi:hypothetical protein
MPSLAFFSYSRHDSDFVLKLAKDLRAAGANLWLDQLDIRAGQHWDTVVAEALGRSTLLLVVLSPESVASSNVMDEVSFALEKQKTVVLVMHKPCEVPFRLRRMQYADFTMAYDKGLAALLPALEIEPVTPSPPTEEKKSFVSAPPPEPQGRVAAQPARDPVVPVGTPDAHEVRAGISRGKLAVGAVAVIVFGAMLWWAVSSRTPSTGAGTNTPPSNSGGSAGYEPSPDKSRGFAVKPEPSGTGGTVATQATPPGAAWVNNFLLAEQGPATSALRPFFDDVVSPYYGIPSVGWAEIAHDKRNYFTRFPSINYALVGEPIYHPQAQGAGTLEFDADYSETRNDGKLLKGRTHMSLSVRSVEGSWKITGITERKGS